METTRNTVTINERTLLMRINREFARDTEPMDVERVLRCRPTSRAYWELGRFYVVSPSGGITATNIDLEDFGRSLGVLRPWEALANA